MVKVIFFSVALVFMPFSAFTQDLGGLLGGLTGSTKESSSTTDEKTEPSAMGAILQGVLTIGAGVAAKEMSKKRNEKKNERLQEEYDKLREENETLRANCQNDSTLKANPEIDEIYLSDSKSSTSSADAGMMGTLGSLAEGFLGDEDELDYAAMNKKYKEQNSKLETGCKKSTFSFSSPSKTTTTKPSTSTSSSSLFGGLFGK